MADMKAWKAWDDMKAWKAWTNWEPSYCTVVFAETRGKAKARAQHTDCLEDAEWTEIHVSRLPELDKEYRGHTQMDWYDQQDRLALIRDAGMRCEYIDMDDCEECAGREFCEAYADYLKEVACGIYEEDSAHE